MGYHPPFSIDRESGVLGFNYEYYIPAYIDPETGEVFEQTTWRLTITEPGVSSWPMSDYAGESGQVWVDSYLLGGNDVHTYIYDFEAYNTFAYFGGISESWTVIAAAYADIALVLTGGDEVNLLIGGLMDDVLRGNGGNDMLDGGEGSDILEGGDGADRLDGGLGDDTMVGGAGDDTYFADSADDSVVEGADGGTDTVVATVSFKLAAKIERLTLGGFDDISGTGNGSDNLITGNGARNILRGAAGNDTLRGEGGDDRLLGGIGDDTLIGGQGADMLDGGAGHDTYIIDEFDTIVETETNYVLSIDRVITAAHIATYTLAENLEFLETWSNNDFHGIGNSGRNAIYGGIGDDLLQGLGDSDSLIGGAGNDRLEGGDGADELRGGDGRDVAIYSGSTVGVYVNLGINQQKFGEAEGDWVLGVEDVIGSSHDDTLIGILNDNFFDGGAGNDTLRGIWGNDRLMGGLGADDMDGGDGNDTLDYSSSLRGVRINLNASTATGGDANGDVIVNFEHVIGSNAIDILRGSTGANQLRGLDGDDRIYGGAGNDVIVGGKGADWLDGQGGVNRLSYSGSAGAVNVDLQYMVVSGGDAQGDLVFNFDNAEGGRGADHIYGHDAAANLLIGGGGNDELYGRGGNDILRGGAGADRLDGGDGEDTVSYAGAAAQVVLYLDSGTGYYGDAAGDTFLSIENAEGGDGNDYILGSAGANRLKGSDGFDWLSGGAGNDYLTGGRNGDTFQFHSDFDRDVITDFVQGEDRIFIDFDGNFSAFEQLSSLISATGAGGIHTKIDFGGGDVLVINNVLSTSLTAADFSFLFE